MEGFPGEWGTQMDPRWNEEYGNRQRTGDGAIYTGSILEHLLIQHLAAFYEVGAHNIPTTPTPLTERWQ